MKTVVYVAGKGRSGSTLLDRLLGGIDGWFSTGELWRLWDWGLEQGYRCGCGRCVRDCPTWRQILGVAFERLPDPSTMVRLRDQVLSWRSAPRLLRRAGGMRDTWPALEEYVDVQRRLYEAVAAVTESRVVVDSSKWPIEPAVLGLVPGVRVLVLHLVRDPRAVAHSWSRTKAYTDRPDVPMDRFGVFHSATSWL
ncbi:MAG: sulfotransferase, partial [Candidatus Binatia bacterium]